MIGSIFPKRASSIIRLNPSRCLVFVTEIPSSVYIMHGGTIVDATIINAPSSTQNKEDKRDSEMHQTQKGHQWYHRKKIYAVISREKLATYPYYPIF